MKQIILFVLSLFLLIFYFMIFISAQIVVDSNVDKEINNLGLSRVIVIMNDNPFNFQKNSDISATDLMSLNIKEKKIHRKLASINGYSMTIDKKDLENLKKNKNIMNIIEDKEFNIGLYQSVPLINATASWNSSISGINLSGFGETVCIIDTGVNYSHQDLGACHISQMSDDGLVENLSIPVESEHNYQDNFDYTWKINRTGFSKISIHFVNLSLEKNGDPDSNDRVIIYDSNQREIASYHGSGEVINDFWTPYSEGDTIYVRLSSDPSVTDYGFYIDKIRNGTTNYSYNWSSCKKVINGWDFKNNDPDPYDDNGHGTHVAGIVAAKGVINGVAKDANIVMAKAMDSIGNGFESDVMYAIEYCANHSEDYNISVISMSLGGGAYSNYCDSSDYYLSKSINYAISKNISVTISSGNNGYTASISDPACIKNATPIASSTKSDAMASYSNRNFMVDLVAPGSSIYSTSISGSYVTLSGTSMAAPHAAGAFALLRQFMRLQNNKIPTPFEIENIYKNSGKIIYDSSSNRNYSRIDVYSAMIYADSVPPGITLDSPSNNTPFSDNDIEISCNFSDFLLKNITISLYNVSGIQDYSTTNVSSQKFSYSHVFSGLSDGSYYYNCNAYDAHGNLGYSNDNFTFYISNNFLILINNPANNLYTNNSQSEFQCSASPPPGRVLKNSTLLIYKNNELYDSSYNQVTGISNTTVFDYNFSLEGNYSYNCLFYDNASKFNYSSTNYTIFVDKTPPVISLLSPSYDFSMDSSGENITFSYNFSDNFQVGNCSILLDNISINLAILNLQEGMFNFSYNLSPGTYLWKVYCNDLAQNSVISEERSISINQPQTNSGVGGGGGGGSEEVGSKSNVNFIKTLSQAELEIGSLQEMKKDDVVKFSFSPSEQHSLSVSQVFKDSIIIMINSTPIITSVNIGESKKFNLTSPDFYDLKITLLSISNSKANLQIAKLNEPIIAAIKKPENKFSIQNAVNNQSYEEKPIPPKESYYKIKDFVLYTIIIFILILLFIIITIIIKRKSHKTMKKYKEVYSSLKPKKILK